MYCFSRSTRDFFVQRPSWEMSNSGCNAINKKHFYRGTCLSDYWFSRKPSRTQVLRLACIISVTPDPTTAAGVIPRQLSVTWGKSWLLCCGRAAQETRAVCREKGCPGRITLEWGRKQPTVWVRGSWVQETLGTNTSGLYFLCRSPETLLSSARNWLF